MLILLFMRGVRMHIRSVLQWIVVAAVVFVSGHAWGQNSSAMSAGTIPAAQLIQVDELKPMLATQDAQKAPVILQVGSHLFFNEAHIPGSQYAGPGSQPAGLALLEKTVSPLPKNRGTGARTSGLHTNGCTSLDTRMSRFSIWPTTSATTGSARAIPRRNSDTSTCD
jgi:hypothetical protein